MTKVLVNGEDTDKFSVFDRGLFYGDGIFRTLELKAGRPLLWEFHWQRLYEDCIGMKLPIPDRDLLKREFLYLSESFPRAWGKPKT